MAGGIEHYRPLGESELSKGNGARLSCFFMRPAHLDLDRLISSAIQGRRLVSFVLRGSLRVGEPHVYGLHNDVAQLLLYQTQGHSSSGPIPGWRRANLSEISEFQILDAGFRAADRASTHQRGWDQIFEEANG